MDLAERILTNNGFLVLHSAGKSNYWCLRPIEGSVGLCIASVTDEGVIDAYWEDEENLKVPFTMDSAKIIEPIVISLYSNIISAKLGDDVLIKHVKNSTLSAVDAAHGMLLAISNLHEPTRSAPVVIDRLMHALVGMELEP